MRNNIKKLVSLFIIVTVILSNITVTNASVKNETVYTSLFSDGKRKNIIVNEHLYGEEQKLNDVSNLKNILNINGDEKYTQNGNTLVWDGNDIFYQGSTDKELPLLVKITYKLNGEEIKKSEMISKSGDVEIIVEFINKDSHNMVINGKNSTLYTPFVVAVGTIISGNGNSNVTVSNGKVVNNGLNNIVVALSTPGLSDSLGISSLSDLNEVTIKYNTKSFTSSPIYMVATPKVLEKDDLKVFDKLNEMYGKISTLTSSMNALVDGGKKLSDGINIYSSKIGELASSLDMLSNGAKQLATNYSAIDSGINTLSSSLQNVDTLLNGTLKVASSVNTLTGGINTLTEKVNGLTSDVNSAKEEINTHIVTLQKIYDETTDMKTKEALGNELNALQQKLSKYDIEKKISLVNEINNGMNQLNSGISEISKSVPTLQSGISTLSSSVNKLKNGSNMFNSKLNEFSTYFNVLDSKLPELENGTKELANGSMALYNGLSDFNNKGVKVLSNSLYSVKNITDKMSKLVGLGEEYQTFTMKDENTKGETKFVMVAQ